MQKLIMTEKKEQIKLQNKIDNLEITVEQAGEAIGAWEEKYYVDLTNSGKIGNDPKQERKYYRYLELYDYQVKIDKNMCGRLKGKNG